MVKVLILFFGCFISFYSNAALSVLLYHRVSDTHKYGISEENFKKQMDYLIENKYIFLNQEELEKKLLKGYDFSDNKYVVVTFDDGWKTQLIAAKILKDRNLPAIFFVNGEPIEKRYGAYLNVDELKEINKIKIFSIADHSYTHKIEVLHNLETLKVDYESNVVFLKKYVKNPSFSYAYPYGAKKAEYIKFLVNTGKVPFIYGTRGFKINDSKSIDLYDIPRFTITNQVNFNSFKYYVK